jgi:predicted NBD/HSP70 family sugar kinase
MITILVIDIGGTKVKFGFTVAGQPHAYMRLFPSSELHNSDPIASLARLIHAVIEEAGLKPDVVVSTVPGFLDPDGDRVLFCANIPELNDRRLASELGARIAIPVVLERDSVLALLGETLAGAARGASAVLGLFFGTGVGAAFLQDGRPFRGAGWALEVGHMPFKGEGRQYEGVRPDYLEAYVSGRALQMIADRHAASIETVFMAAAGKEELASDLDAFLRNQAFAIGAAVAMFSPQVIVLGGGICEMPGFPRERLSTLIESSFPFARTRRSMDLRWAELGWRSVLYGASHVVLEHLRRQD